MYVVSFEVVFGWMTCMHVVETIVTCAHELQKVSRSLYNQLVNYFIFKKTCYDEFQVRVKPSYSISEWTQIAIVLSRRNSMSRVETIK